MSAAKPSHTIPAFLCRVSVKGKLRVVFHFAIPAVGAHVSIGEHLFEVESIVHPLNLYGNEYHGDRAIEIFVKPKSSSRLMKAESYDEMSLSAFSTNTTLFS